MEQRRWGFVLPMLLILVVLTWTTAAEDAALGLVAVGAKRHAYAAMMYMGTPRDYEFYVATRVMMRSLSKLRVDADLVVIASDDVPIEWVQAMYRVAYDGAIATLPGKAQWKVLDDLVQIGVPNSSRPRGRPRKRRLINFLEKEKKAHKCGRCGSWGHHRSTCKNSLQKMSDEGTYSTQYGITRRDKLASRRNVDNSGFEEFEYSYLDGL